MGLTDIMTLRCTHDDIALTPAAHTLCGEDRFLMFECPLDYAS